MSQHRVTLTEKHFHLVRTFMVRAGLPSARAATERMIELAAEEAEGTNGGGEIDETHTRVRRPLIARSQV